MFRQTDTCQLSERRFYTTKTHTPNIIGVIKSTGWTFENYLKYIWKESWIMKWAGKSGYNSQMWEAKRSYQIVYFFCNIGLTLDIYIIHISYIWQENNWHFMAFSPRKSHSRKRSISGQSQATKWPYNSSNFHHLN